MAKVNPKMVANVNASIVDRQAPPGSSGAPRPAASPPPALGQHGDTVKIRQALRIPLGSIVPDPDQPRTEFDEAELDALAESLKARGQLQPIRVRWVEAMGRYMVLVGERRYRASIKAGLATIDCIVAEGNPTSEDILEDQLIENALRQDLRPVEQARAYRRLLAARGMTQDQLAGRLQIGQASIARALALLNLPEPIQAKVDAGSIPPNIGYELSKVGDPGEQAELAQEAEAGRLKRDQIKERTRTRTPRASKPTQDGSRTFRFASGASVVVSRAGGLDPDELVAALHDALAVAEAEREIHRE